MQSNYEIQFCNCVIISSYRYSILLFLSNQLSSHLGVKTGLSLATQNFENQGPVIVNDVEMVINYHAGFVFASKLMVI